MYMRNHNELFIILKVMLARNLELLHKTWRQDKITVTVYRNRCKLLTIYQQKICHGLRKLYILYWEPEKLR